MNVTSLTKVAQSSRAADVVFKYLAGRERASWNLNLGRVFSELHEKGISISRNDFNQVFEALEKIGSGSVVHGRRGGATRFLWNYSFRDAATQTLQSIEAKKPISAKSTSGGKSAEKAPTIIQITLPPSVSQEDIKAFMELAKSISK